MEFIKPHLRRMNSRDSEIKVSLRGARILSGYSVRQVATSIGVSPSMLYQYERHPDSVMPSTAKKLSKVYNIPVDAIRFVSQ